MMISCGQQIASDTCAPHRMAFGLQLRSIQRNRLSPGQSFEGNDLSAHGEQTAVTVPARNAAMASVTAGCNAGGVGGGGDGGGSA